VEERTVGRHRSGGGGKRGKERSVRGASEGGALGQGSLAPLAERVRDWLGFPADSLQARMLETHGKRGILNCTRRRGKSTVTAAEATRQA